MPCWTSCEDPRQHVGRSFQWPYFQYGKHHSTLLLVRSQKKRRGNRTDTHNGLSWEKQLRLVIAKISRLVRSLSQRAHKNTPTTLLNQHVDFSRTATYQFSADHRLQKCAKKRGLLSLVPAATLPCHFMVNNIHREPLQRSPQDLKQNIFVTTSRDNQLGKRDVIA